MKKASNKDFMKNPTSTTSHMYLHITSWRWRRRLYLSAYHYWVDSQRRIKDRPRHLWISMRNSVEVKIAWSTCEIILQVPHSTLGEKGSVSLPPLPSRHPVKGNNLTTKIVWNLNREEVPTNSTSLRAPDWLSRRRDLPLKKQLRRTSKIGNKSSGRSVKENGIITYHLWLQHGRAADKLLLEDSWPVSLLEEAPTIEELREISDPIQFYQEKDARLWSKVIKGFLTTRLRILFKLPRRLTRR